jgi:hypothetical protein
MVIIGVHTHLGDEHSKHIINHHSLPIYSEDATGLVPWCFTFVLLTLSLKL